MRKIILYIAMSLDGYIANKDGKVDWLEGDGSDKNNVGTYFSFIENIDTVILGYKTYHQIITELSPQEWPYKGMKSYVFKNKIEPSNNEDIEFINEDIISFVQNLKNKNGKDIWICGGANLLNQFIDSNLIDFYQIAIIPTILGDGIPLFQKLGEEKKLTLISSISYNGTVEVLYKNRIKATQ
ncbi:MAG: dihydrofolate reductase family protein [Cetobacterium sp.]